MKALICLPIRTAIGSFQGSLSTVPAPDLAAKLISTLVEKTKVAPDSINEVILGSVLTAAQGQAPARQAVIKGGLPTSVQAMTINKVCSSGLKAVMLAAQQIELGISRSIIAGGMENMSLAPYYVTSLRGGARLGNTTCDDSILKDALWDVYRNYHMGSAAELCAREFKLSREDQDAFAIESYTRAQKAIADGNFKREIVGIKIKKGKEEVLFDTDEEPGKGNIEKIPTLKPVFEKDGTVTAANASSINDGASLMLVCDEAYAKEQNLQPVAEIVSMGWHAHAPEWFTTAPVGAVQSAIHKAGIKISDVELFELNEAFSAVALACRQGLEIPSNILNISGGAVALGHPVGASGARILTTLIYALIRNKKKLGAVGICNGGGEATAMVVRALS